jgi:carboxyl-terminal processing protease
MSPLVRRLWRAVGLVALAAVAFGAGLVTGVVGSPAPKSRTSVVDEAEQRIVSQAAHPVDRSALEHAAVQGMLDALRDRWSAYYTPDQFQQFSQGLQGSYSGIGVWLRSDPRGDQVVDSVQPGSPAADAGLVAGDRITAVGGISTHGQSVANVVDALRGPTGTSVTVTLVRAGVTATVTVTRVTLVVHDVTVRQLGNGVTLIKVAAFTRGVGRQVREAVARLSTQTTAGVVLDLRGNPGGLLDEGVEVASVFLDGGPVVSYQRRGHGVRTLSANPGGNTTTPLVVLVDGATASAAEVVAAALQDRNRAVIVGSRTFGKGSVQEPTRLSDGSAIELTVGRYRTPNGRMIDGKGIEPDVYVDPSYSPDYAEQRALEVLLGLMASVPTTSSRG